MPSTVISNSFRSSGALTKKNNNKNPTHQIKYLLQIKTEKANSTTAQHKMPRKQRRENELGRQGSTIPYLVLRTSPIWLFPS